MQVEIPIDRPRTLEPTRWAGTLRIPSMPSTLVIGLAILVGWLLVSLIVPIIVGRDAEQVVFGAKLQPPSAEYLFGTDALGRDVLVRTVIAFRYDLLVSVISVIAAAVGGVMIGALAGSSREWLDNVIMRVIDILQAFPSFVLAIVLAVALGTSIQTLIFSIALVLLPLHARGTRAAILAERSKPYADAARAMAIPPTRILFVHLLPNSLRPTLTQMAIDMSNAIMITAAVSFLGFGIQSPTPEWGLMMNEGGSYIVNGQWWVTFFPGLGILSLVLAFFLLDLGLKRMQERG
jgi:ABC-type dipeptide/oligopeptide/nickel transport system permease subunit